MLINSLLDWIGKTPLLSLEASTKAKIAKASSSTLGSIKDRVAKFMLDEAERRAFETGDDDC